jgi:hypothetical protein
MLFKGSAADFDRMRRAGPTSGTVPGEHATLQGRA